MEPNQDTFSSSVSSLLERHVRGWLSGVLEDMRRSSPVQQWLDSLPVPSGDEDHTSSLPDLHNEELALDTMDNDAQPIKPEKSNDITHISKVTLEESNWTKSTFNEAKGPIESFSDCTTQNQQSLTETTTKTKDKLEETTQEMLDISIPKEQWKGKSLESGVLTSTPRGKAGKLQRDFSGQSEGYVTKFKNPLLRDASLQSDASGSSSSSVLNVLGARKVDAESVLLALGFGPSEKQQRLQRIPDRFLVPSKMNGISTEKFIKDEQLSMKMHDCGLFGYRGLTGNPHVPPSTIVAKIMECLVKDETSRERTLSRPRYSLGDARVPSASAIPPRLATRLHYN